MDFARDLPDDSLSSFYVGLAAKGTVLISIWRQVACWMAEVMECQLLRARAQASVGENDGGARPGVTGEAEIDIDRQLQQYYYRGRQEFHGLGNVGLAVDYSRVSGRSVGVGLVSKPGGLAMWPPPQVAGGSPPGGLPIPPGRGGAGDGGPLARFFLSGVFGIMIAWSHSGGPFRMCCVSMEVGCVEGARERRRGCILVAFWLAALRLRVPQGSGGVLRCHR